MIRLICDQSSKNAHWERFGESISKRLLKIANNKRGYKAVREFFKTLHSLFDDKETSFLIGAPSVLRKVIRECNRRMRRMNHKELARTKRLCEKIFDYSKFASAKQGWSAAKYVQNLNVRYCPYCNAETIYSLEIDKKSLSVKHARPAIIRSPLDHYYSQREYPYLALSLCNLVPCCTRCNSSIKHDREFKPFDKFANPYEDNLHDDVRFDYIIKRPSPCFIDDETALGLRINPCANTSTKAMKLMDFFQVEKVYNELFIYEAAEIIERKRMMMSGYAQYLKENMPGLTTSQFNKLVYGYSLDPYRINIERLSKLAIDVIKR